CTHIIAALPIIMLLVRKLLLVSFFYTLLSLVFRKAVLASKWQNWHNFPHLLRNGQNFCYALLSRQHKRYESECVSCKRRQKTWLHAKRTVLFSASYVSLCYKQAITTDPQ